MNINTNYAQEFIDNLKGYTFTPEEAAEIKSFIDGGTHHSRNTLPLQCGERLFVRGELWEVQKIYGDDATMKRVDREAETPKEIRDLIWEVIPASTEHDDPVSEHNTDVLAAFLRGKDSKK